MDFKRIPNKDYKPGIIFDVGDKVWFYDEGEGWTRAIILNNEAYHMDNGYEIAYIDFCGDWEVRFVLHKRNNYLHIRED